MTVEINLYLASQSPRRSELLSQIGFSFSVLAVNVDETVNENENPQDYVLRLAKDKAKSGWFSAKHEYEKVVLPRAQRISSYSKRVPNDRFKRQEYSRTRGRRRNDSSRVANSERPIWTT